MADFSTRYSWGGNRLVTSDDLGCVFDVYSLQPTIGPVCQKHFQYQSICFGVSCVVGIFWFNDFIFKYTYRLDVPDDFCASMACDDIVAIISFAQHLIDPG